MHTEIRQIDSSYHVMEVAATAEELEDDVKRAIRKVSRKTRTKGFRPGHVPVNLVKRLYRSELAELVSVAFIDEVFTDMVSDLPEYDVFGYYLIIEMDYELGQDLRAEVGFNVIPEIDIDALKRHSVPVYFLSIIDNMADYGLQMMLRRNGCQRPMAEGEEIWPTDMVHCSITEVDWDTEIPLIGGHSEEAAVDFLDILDEPYRSLAKAVVGLHVGDTTYFEASIEESDSELVYVKQQKKCFRVKLLGAERLDFSQLSEGKIREMSEGASSTIKELWTFVAEGLQRKSNQIAMDFTIKALIEKTIELHPFDFPPKLLEVLKVPEEEYDDLRKALRWVLVCKGMGKQVPRLADNKGDDVEVSEDSTQSSDGEEQQTDDLIPSLDQQARVIAFLSEAFERKEVDILSMSLEELEASRYVKLFW